MCCEDYGSDHSDGVEGVCEHCGAETYGGYAKDVCGYSPCVCEYCGYAPCDDSC